MFTETNPDKGTETYFRPPKTNLFISLQKLTPIRGRKHSGFTADTFLFFLKFTETNPDKGTETRLNTHTVEFNGKGLQKLTPIRGRKQ